MKRFLFLLLALPFYCISQTAVELPMEFVTKTLGNNKTGVKYKGSPYLNDDFIMGEVAIDKSRKFKTKLRYNAYSDEFELLTDGNVSALFKNADARILLRNKSFGVYSYMDGNSKKEEYFEILNKSGKILFLKKNHKKFVEASKPQNGYSEPKPAKFVEEITYFIKNNDGGELQEIKLKKKSILSVLGGDNSLLKKYIKSHKLKLKKESDVIKLFNYYSSL